MLIDYSDGTLGEALVETNAHGEHFAPAVVVLRRENGDIVAAWPHGTVPTAETLAMFGVEDAAYVGEILDIDGGSDADSEV